MSEPDKELRAQLPNGRYFRIHGGDLDMRDEHGHLVWYWAWDEEQVKQPPVTDEELMAIAQKVLDINEWDVHLEWTEHPYDDPFMVEGAFIHPDLTNNGSSHSAAC